MPLLLLHAPRTCRSGRRWWWWRSRSRWRRCRHSCRSPVAGEPAHAGGAGGVPFIPAQRLLHETAGGGRGGRPLAAVGGVHVAVGEAALQVKAQAPAAQVLAALAAAQRLCSGRSCRRRCWYDALVVAARLARRALVAVEQKRDRRRPRQGVGERVDRGLGGRVRRGVERGVQAASGMSSGASGAASAAAGRRRRGVGRGVGRRGATDRRATGRRPR